MPAWRSVLIATLLLTWPCSAWADADHPHVLDHSRALFETTRDQIEAESRALQADTGIELFVVVEPELGGRTAREVALTQPFWNPDREQVVLLLGMEEHVVRIEASPSIAQRISDADWSRVIETSMLPELRHGRPGAAVRAGTRAVVGVLETGSVPSHTSRMAGDTRSLREMVFILIAGLLAVLSFSGARHLVVQRGRW